MKSAERMKKVEELIRRRDREGERMLKSSPDQLSHSWECWGKAGDLQREIDRLLEEEGIRKKILERELSNPIN